MHSPVRHLLIAIFSWAAQQERDRIRERISAGFQRVREKNGVISRAGFGLRNVRDKEKDITVRELDPATLPTVRRAGELAVAVGSRRGAALRLTAEGAPPPSKGGAWGHVAVKRLLLSSELRAFGAWPPALLEKIDRLVASRQRPAGERTARGAAAPKNLASSFLACGACGGGLTVVACATSAEYACSRCNAKGIKACRGVGRRAVRPVERALVSMIRPFIDGPAKDRALQIVRARLDARPEGPATEREAIAFALADAERGGEAIARAIRQGGKLESLIQEAKDNDQEKKRLRARLARLDGLPVASLDAKRHLPGIEARLADLSRALDEGGIAAYPAVKAVLNGRRLEIVPVTVKGQRRWSLVGRISAGYLATIDGSDPEGRYQRRDHRAAAPVPPGRVGGGYFLTEPSWRRRAHSGAASEGASEEDAASAEASAGLGH